LDLQKTDFLTFLVQTALILKAGMGIDVDGGYRGATQGLSQAPIPCESAVLGLGAGNF
jgi:hypothetical protein